MSKPVSVMSKPASISTGGGREGGLPLPARACPLRLARGEVGRGACPLPARALLSRLRNPWTDHRAERTLGAVSLLACLCVLFMIAFVAVRAWPTFAHNGLSWLGPGGSLKVQFETMLATPTHTARLRLPPARLADHLRHAADHRSRPCCSRCRSPCSPRSSSSSSPRPPAPHDDPRRAPARLRALGHLGPARDPRARAVRRQPPHHHL